MAVTASWLDCVHMTGARACRTIQREVKATLPAAHGYSGVQDVDCCEDCEPPSSLERDYRLYRPCNAVGSLGQVED